MRVRILGSLLLAVCCAGCSTQPPPQLAKAGRPAQAKISITRAPLPPGPPVMVDSIDGPHPAEAPPALIDINETHIGNQIQKGPVGMERGQYHPEKNILRT